MRIKNFEHFRGTITFDVDNRGEIFQVEMATDFHGTVGVTDIDDFTKNYTVSEYDALENFVDGCVNLLLNGGV